MLPLFALQKLLLFLVVPICIAIPFYYFNRWLISKIRPAENITRMLMYYLVMLPVAFVLVTVCIYIILRGYLWMKRD
jgi:hypothetical protein